MGRQDRSTPRGFRALSTLLDVLARVQRSASVAKRPNGTCIKLSRLLGFGISRHWYAAQLPIPGLGAPSVHGAPPNICRSLWFCFRVVFGRFLIRLSDSLFLAPQSDLEKNQNAVRKGLARNAQIRGVFGSPP